MEIFKSFKCQQDIYRQLCNCQSNSTHRKKGHESNLHQKNLLFKKNSEENYSVPATIQEKTRCGDRMCYGQTSQRQGCKCSVLGTGQLAVIPLTMNTSCQKVFEDNERSPVKQMRCSQEQHKIPILIFQQQQKNTFRVMEWPGQHKSHCWGNLERRTHVRKPSNILEIKGERSKTPTGDIKDQCNILFN